jgi:hypothetical protein
MKNLHAPSKSKPIEAKTESPQQSTNTNEMIPNTSPTQTKIDSPKPYTERQSLFLNEQNLKILKSSAEENKWHAEVKNFSGQQPYAAVHDENNKERFRVHNDGKFTTNETNPAKNTYETLVNMLKGFQKLHGDTPFKIKAPSEDDVTLMKNAYKEVFKKNLPSSYEIDAPKSPEIQNEIPVSKMRI